MSGPTDWILRYIKTKFFFLLFTHFNVSLLDDGNDGNPSGGDLEPSGGSTVGSRHSADTSPGEDIVTVYFFVRAMLYRIFHWFFRPEILALFADWGPALPSWSAPPAGYERAWIIFVGVNIEGAMHFIYHIAESYSTSRSYNGVDPVPGNSPALLHGRPFHVKTSVMDVIRKGFPKHHKGKVPVQMCLAITPKSKIAQGCANKVPLISFLDGTADEIDTRNFTVRKLIPTGTDSLSFKRDGFPIQFWTHPSRAQVIRTALQLEQRKTPPNLRLVNLYQQACIREDALTVAERSLKNQVGALEGEKRALQRAQNNDRIPAEKKADVIAQKKANILKLERVIHYRLVAKAAVAKRAIQYFKRQNFTDLPNSYREATFQVAVYKTSHSGCPEHRHPVPLLLKQYNSETGMFEPANYFYLIARLCRIFHRLFRPEILALFADWGPALPSWSAPPAGYERAWRIFMGVNIEGAIHFICHIAESCSISKGYSGGDPVPGNCPALLHGRPFHVKTSVMDVIREGFPKHYKGMVPVQMCLAITPKSKSAQGRVPLISFLDGTADEIDTRNFTVRKLIPTGTESLSFKRDGFPIQFWTREATFQVAVYQTSPSGCTVHVPPVLLKQYNSETGVFEIARDVRKLDDVHNKYADLAYLKSLRSA